MRTGDSKYSDNMTSSFGISDGGGCHYYAEYRQPASMGAFALTVRTARTASPLNRITIVSALNLPFDEWTEIFGSERLTGALLDRITHHVHILEMNADSYRLKQSRRKRG
jgi:hypothetical protein